MLLGPKLDSNLVLKLVGILNRSYGSGPSGKGRKGLIGP